MNVKLFAQLRDLAGRETIDLPASGPLTADELWQLLDVQVPGIVRHKQTSRIAHNLSYAARDATFCDGDEIAIIPPVSGG